MAKYIVEIPVNAVLQLTIESDSEDNALSIFEELEINIFEDALGIGIVPQISDIDSCATRIISGEDCLDYDHMTITKEE